ncbi:MAG: hypothetical protein ABSC77_01660 [Terracidiphilus sp.]|jgi:hypothetical protein
MDTASFQFVAFGLGVALLVNLSRNPAWRLTVLALSSLVFLATLTRQPLTLLPLAGFLIVGYLIVKVLQCGVPQLAGRAWW